VWGWRVVGRTRPPPILVRAGGYLGIVIRGGVTALLGVTLAACSGADPAAAPVTSTAAASAHPPWRHLACFRGPLPRRPPVPLSAAKMLAEMQRWVDEKFMPGATAAVVSPDGVWTAA